MAKIHSGNDKIMVMEHGYHGHTQTGIDISDYKFNHPKGQGQKTAHPKDAVSRTAYNGKYSGLDCGIRNMQKTPLIRDSYIRRGNRGLYL